MSVQQQPNPFPELEQIRQWAMKSTSKVEKLTMMKDWLDRAKVISAQGEGQIKQMELQRVQEFGCSTDEEAAEMILELEGSVADLEQELEVGIATIVEEMGWDR